MFKIQDKTTLIRVFQQKPKAYPNDNEAKESIKLIDIED